MFTRYTVQNFDANVTYNLGKNPSFFSAIYEKLSSTFINSFN